MPRFLPVGKDAKGAARFLLAALPALGALLTALAITGNLVGRMARNHPVTSFAAFGCAALAVFLGAVAAFGLRENSPEERNVLHVGLVVLGAGLVFTVYGGVRTWGDRPQPSITVTAKHGSVVAVTVPGVGLRSSEHMVVEVEQLLRVTGKDGRHSWKSGLPLYGASLGPDGGGVGVDQPPGVHVGRVGKFCGCLGGERRRVATDRGHTDERHHRAVRRWTDRGGCHDRRIRLPGGGSD